MFNKSLPSSSSQETMQNRQAPRVTHTPGAYPPLQPRGGQSTETAQAAQAISAQQIPAANGALVQATDNAPEHDREGGNRLLVGPDVKLKGAEILDCDTLIVEGRVEATMDSRVIRIAEKGAYNGKVGIDVAEIHGNFEGELTARQKLIIHATGRVKGTIRYGSLLIEAGGQICGDIQALEQTRNGDSRISGKEVERTKVTSLISSVA
jgi:cytoskeletal protein CcmA (bactofilin family)